MSHISNSLKTRGYRFVTIILSIITSLICPTVNAQHNQNIFDKIKIEIEGEDIYDVYAITQDHQGYIWMGTNLGLIRYDGIEGKIYHPDTPYLLYLDSHDDLWIGHSSGISKYNPDCDCLNDYPAISDNSPVTNISSITEDKNNNLWIGTRDGEIFQHNEERNSFTKFLLNDTDTMKSVKPIIHLLVDSNNNMWIGTMAGLVLFNIDDGTIKQFSHNPNDKKSLIDNRISALFEGNQGQILIGTYKSGLHIYNAKKGSLDRINPHKNAPNVLHAPYAEDNVYGGDPFVRLIHQDQHDNYWISTTGKGINHFDTKTTRNVNYHFDLINPQLLWSLFEDRQGNLWIGGIGGSGLFRTDLYGRRYTINNNFSNVESAYESPVDPGTLWIKSRQGGLSKLDSKTKEISNYLHDSESSTSIGHNWVRSAYQENSRILWVGLGSGGAFGGGSGDGGIDRMDIENETFMHFKLTRPDDGLDDFSYTVYNICQDKEGFLWLGTGPGGIFRSNKNRTKFAAFKSIESEDSNPNHIFNIVKIDSDGDLWASDFSGQGTLYLYNRQDGEFRPYLNGFRVTNVSIDMKGWLLISTWEKGFLHLNPSDRSYTQFTKKDGLPSNDAIDIVEDKDGLFWINTRMGPAKFHSGTNEIVAVGLPKMRYNFGIWKALDGRVLLGVNNGLISFSAGQVEGNPFPPQVSMSDLTVSEISHLAEYRLSNELILSHNQNDIEITYVGLHFSNPEKNLYQYKLNPLDDKWVNVGTKRTIRFAKLSPGSYNFQVKASNSDGIWSEPLDYTFTINPPWWNTLWAKTGYGIAALLLIIGIIYWRTLKLLQRQKKLETVVENATLEIRTQKEEVESQKDEIEAQRDQLKIQRDLVVIQKQEITDSINYAQRIQSAVLPDKKYMESVMSGFFVLYKPRDIVSGDFYWIKEIKNHLVIVVADCTGHGVPGAIMSMLGISLLNEQVGKSQLEKPSDILNRLREKVKDTLGQEGKKHEQQDGMELALVIIDKEGRKLQYAGAYHPLYLIRKKDHLPEHQIAQYSSMEIKDYQLFELKGDRQPISIYSIETDFTTKQIQLKEGDTIYMFSDGFVDQKGGPNNKRFMSKNFKKTLLDIQTISMEEQKHYLDNTLTNWSKGFNQVDDILVMGVKIFE